MQFFNDGDSLDILLKNVSSPPITDEEALIQDLIGRIRSLALNSEKATTVARTLIENLRKVQPESPVKSLLEHYDIQTEEGLALMCLAEAMLRIPDSDSRDELIHDKLSNIEWKEKSHKDETWFTQSTDIALKFAGYLSDTKASNYFKRAGSMLSEPIIRTAIKHTMRLMGSQFVLGETMQSAMEFAENYKGYRFSYDTLGEGARTDRDAQNYFNKYIEAIEAIGNNADKELPSLLRNGISIKLSALFPRYELTHYERVMEELLPRLRTLAENAHYYGIPVTIDAEEASRLDISLQVFRELVLNGKEENIGLAVQAYNKSSQHVLDFIIELAKTSGKKIPVRLVKGAYWDAEIKHAQVEGLRDYPVFTQKPHTDISYLACAQKLVENMDVIYPQFATHNAHTIAMLLDLLKDKPKDSYEFQRLHGMGKRIYDQLIDKHQCRVYAPVGQHKELLPYLIRRLLENGANSSFVHHLSDRSVPVDRLIVNPIEARTQHYKIIPRPDHIYGNVRKNSRGVDFGNAIELLQLEKKVTPHLSKTWRAESLCAHKPSPSADIKITTSPINAEEEIGTIRNATKEDCPQAVKHAVQSFNAWSQTMATHRADLLEKVAILFEANQAELIALSIREAGKTMPNAVNEVREAIDFCRYYAAEGRKLFSHTRKLASPTGEKNFLSLHGRGVFVCISPWNFPIAIFTGQIVAALMAGNCVIAKPAAQTSLIGYFIVQLMHKAGIPKHVLQLMVGSGRTVGMELVKDERIAGVVFTGSTTTAQTINKALAERTTSIPVFIAETGGQNCMIADSSCLPEQLVDDIIMSSFDSSGQRCSALRVLYLQEDIADDVITMLRGAINELHIGNPAHLYTDMGPVIDKGAQETLEKHIEHMSKEAQAHYTIPLPRQTEKGTFVAPHIFEIDSIKQLKQEVFGPVLHTIRYNASMLDVVLEEVNSTGYGLTFGIHSRINERIDYICQRVHAGNIYINRSMIGATVGVQPFGGEGLSGTGPKAGGPHYLLRFATERTVTNNIAAIGGNVELLS